MITSHDKKDHGCVQMAISLEEKYTKKVLVYLRTNKSNKKGFMEGYNVAFNRISAALALDWFHL